MNILDYTKCYTRVWGGWNHHRCQKKAVVVRNDTPYCRIHDPEYIKARRLEKQTKFDKEQEERAESRRLSVATTINNALDNLIDTECPHCHKQLDLPSLEDIQEWLKEER